MGATSATPVHHKWHEIADPPADIEQFRDLKLESLQQVWVDRRADFQDSREVESFRRELARTWAIETGIIEGVYTLDRGITKTLIKRGIDASYISHKDTNRDPELVARTIRTHEEVLDGLSEFVIGGRELSTSYIKELHAALLRYQDTTVAFNQFGEAFEIKLEKGVYKKYPNNPTRPDGSVHEYCPLDHVDSEMDRLVGFYRRQLDRGVLAVADAAWFHHAFTQIHPFQDGNGRVARAVASLILIKDGFFPLVVERDDREGYIDALEAADSGNLSNLIDLFAVLQKRALRQAIGAAAQAKPVASVDDAVGVARDLLIDLGRIIPPQYLEAKKNSGRLLGVTRDRLSSISSMLANDIARANSDFRFAVVMLGGPPVDELRLISEKLKYDPNPADYFQNSTLALSAQGVESRIVVCFQTIGSAFRGLIGAVAYFQAGPGPVALSDDIFRIDYQERYEELQQRFVKWLDDCLIRGLAEWRKTLL